MKLVKLIHKLAPITKKIKWLKQSELIKLKKRLQSQINTTKDAIESCVIQNDASMDLMWSQAYKFIMTIHYSTAPTALSQLTNSLLISTEKLLYLKTMSQRKIPPTTGPCLITMRSAHHGWQKKICCIRHCKSHLLSIYQPNTLLSVVWLTMTD